jgi:hypothetical protein
MNFLSGWHIIAYAAAATVPPLVALYFLKLKRREQPIPSTLLWKRAVQDLHVNSPFQRLRRNLLMLLQLLVLLLAAFALGKPILEAQQTHEGTVILMIDQSASMNVREEDGRTRLEIAKQQAGRVIDNMKDGAQAMVIAFSDKAAILSSFDTDRAALKARIDGIEPTESLSTLTEALALAEAHATNLVIDRSEEGGGVLAPDLTSAAGVVLITDGRVQDADQVVSQRFRTENMEIINVARRTDNVGIVAMEARRHYERPGQVEVFAEVRNFGEGPVRNLDVMLYLEGTLESVQTLSQLEPGLVPPAADGEEGAAPAAGGVSRAARQTGPPPGSTAAVTFQNVTFGGGGEIEVRIRIDDALQADNRAWTVIRPPRNTELLMVSEGNLFLDRVMQTLPVRLTRMTPEEYEKADDETLLDGPRSRFDLVMFDRHSTRRLPAGNYFFWGSVPQIEGVEAADPVRNEIFVNWDETHPVLRHVAVENIQVLQWRRLTVPPEATRLIDGETSPVLVYLSREGRQYLISAFSLVAADDETGEPVLNTFWVTQTHFPMFCYNAVQYLAATLATSGQGNVWPGEPMLIPVTGRASKVTVRRPDGRTDTVDTLGSDTVPYAQTRTVGVYRVTPTTPGQERFAVNLFSATESNVAPNEQFALGAEAVAGTKGVQKVQKPLWPYVLLAALALVLLEWIIYNKRVFV